MGKARGRKPTSKSKSGKGSKGASAPQEVDEDIDEEQQACNDAHVLDDFDADGGTAADGDAAANGDAAADGDAAALVSISFSLLL